MRRKIFLSVALIFFVAILSGCGSAVKEAAKNVGKGAVKTVQKAPRFVKDQAVDMAVEVAVDEMTDKPGGRQAAPSNSRIPSAKPSTVTKAGALVTGGALAAEEIFSEDKQQNHAEDFSPKTNPEDDARQAFLNYHAAITDGNYRAAYETLSYKQRERVGDFDSYVAGFANTISSEVTDITLRSSDADTYTFDYVLTARDRHGKGIKVATFTGQVTMAKDNGRWYVRYAKSAKTDERYE